MRKEKLSYVILLAEIAAIIWLHSVKPSENKVLAPGNIVDLKKIFPTAPPEVNYTQAVYRQP